MSDGWRAAAVLGVLGALGVSQPADAMVISEDELEGSSTVAGAVWRNFGFTLAGPTLAPPYLPVAASPSFTGIMDTRLYLERKTERYQLHIHPQLTLRAYSHAIGGLAGLGRGPAPPRFLPLQYDFVQDETFELRGQIDRLSIGLSVGPAQITLGRQAVTFGRGKIWKTSDLVSTFSMTEVDTEYKPGSDVLRVDISLGPSRDLTVLFAPGELESEEHDAEMNPEGSVALARYQHGFGRAEFGVMAGWVRGDIVASIDGVIDVGNFDLHAETTLVRTTEHSLAAPGADGAFVPKALVGATVKASSKITFSPEVMYGGFGTFDPDAYAQLLTSERVAIGEQTTVGRLYAGMATTMELSPLWTLVNVNIVNLTDPSALWSLAVQHDLASNAKILFGAYAPMGAYPATGGLPIPRSEFGSYPYFVFTELKGVL